MVLELLAERENARREPTLMEGFDGIGWVLPSHTDVVHLLSAMLHFLLRHVAGRREREREREKERGERERERGERGRGRERAFWTQFKTCFEKERHIYS